MRPAPRRFPRAWARERLPNPGRTEELKKEAQGIMTLDVFDGAMGEDDIRAHHAATVNAPELKPKYVDPPPLR
mgnify:CR=1 FL=1